MLQDLEQGPSRVPGKKEEAGQEGLPEAGGTLSLLQHAHGLAGGPEESQRILKRPYLSLPRGQSLGTQEPIALTLLHLQVSATTSHQQKKSECRRD